MTYEKCENNIQHTREILENLGFTIHPQKSILTPTQELIFLGFIINSKTMTLTITSEKKEKIYNQCLKLYISSVNTIRDVASVIGNLVAAMQAAPYGLMHYRYMEIDKIAALKLNNGNFERKMTLSKEAKIELKWWMDNIKNVSRSLIPIPIDCIIYTDASKSGWGATDSHTSIGGPWSEQEILTYEFIHELELLAAKHAIVSIFKTKVFKHVKIMSDNTTAVAYINHMGGIKSPVCNQLATELWEWAQREKIWVSAAHVPGVDNKEADKKSRQFNLTAEWMITSKTFENICKVFGRPDIDLFATRLNKRIERYVSWKPEPECVAVDAFTLNWRDFDFIYCFPPFSIIRRVLAKIRNDKLETALIVVPYWTTQSWFPTLTGMMCAIPRIITATKQHLILPGHPEVQHPLCPKLRLMITTISGNISKVEDFQKKLEAFYWPPGGKVLEGDTTTSLDNGNYFVVNGKKIHMLPL